jgi:hypothetical protein
MMNRYYEVTQHSAGYSMYQIPLGIFAGFPEPKSFSGAADLQAELVKLDHTPAQIESMMQTLNRLGGVRSQVPAFL